MLRTNIDLFSDKKGLKFKTNGTDLMNHMVFLLSSSLYVSISRGDLTPDYIWQWLIHPCLEQKYFFVDKGQYFMNAHAKLTKYLNGL